MVRITGEMMINRPVETVFDFVADERNEPLYNSQMVSAEKISSGPIGVGTRFNAVVAGKGGNAGMVIKITAYKRPVMLSTFTHLSVMDINGTLTFNSVENGTRMEWFWEIKPRSIFKLITPFIKSTGERQEKRIWSGLKQYLEEREKTKVQDKVD